MHSQSAHLPLAAHLLPARIRRKVQESSGNITTAPRLPWHEIGPAQEHLLAQLRSMYWDGVKREMAHILLTLKKWQQPEYASISLSDEADDFVHGFDTFTDQVNGSSRDVAARYGESGFVARSSVAAGCGVFPKLAE